MSCSKGGSCGTLARYTLILKKVNADPLAKAMADLLNLQCLTSVAFAEGFSRELLSFGSDRALDRSRFVRMKLEQSGITSGEDLKWLTQACISIRAQISEIAGIVCPEERCIALIDAIFRCEDRISGSLNRHSVGASSPGY